MKKHLIICGLLFCIGCKHTEPTLEPASVLAGTYVSSDFVTFDKKIPFPINGKSITMKITRVAADTVDIRVSAPANELYSPARDTTYRKVYILTKPQGYYLTLEADNTLPGNQLGSELMIAPPVAPAASPNWVSYVFVPPNYKQVSVSVLSSKKD